MEEMKQVDRKEFYKVDEKGVPYREAIYYYENGSTVKVIDYAVTPELQEERRIRLEGALERFYKSVVREGGHWISEEEMAAEAVAGGV